MNDDLRKITKQWMELERKTLEQRKLAEDFYEKNLMELIEKDYVERNHDKVFEKAKCFVVSVGTSYEPIVLNLKLFNPNKVLFLCTSATEDTLEKIVNYCRLKPKDYEKSRVSETNPLDIYREIKKYYLAWGKPHKMYIDFTGGTKAMSAAAAMAGAMIDVQLVYVGTNDYLVDFRKPNPGSETLYFITNPLSVFGDLEIEKSLVLFERFNYVGAQERLEALKDNIPDPNMRQQLNFVYLLAKTYEAWDALDFQPAYEYMVMLNRELKRDKVMHGTFLMMDYSGILERQGRILEHLSRIPQMLREKNNMSVLRSKELIMALMFTMYQNALTREKQQKFDMATLLLYRLLEMIEQRRLAHYNLYVSDMDYQNIKYNEKNLPEIAEISKENRLAWLKEQIIEVRKSLFGKNVSSYLPEQISLLDGFILLKTLGDPIVRPAKGNAIDVLKRMRAMVYLRNNSIFAHGLGPVGENDYLKFKNYVEEMFQKFCHIEHINYKTYSRDMEMVNPMKSRYYAAGMEAD